MAELADFVGNMVSPGAAPFSPSQELPALGAWAHAVKATPLSLYQSHIYTQGDQPYWAVPGQELPGFVGTTGALNQRAALTGYVAQQFFTGKMTAAQVQRRLQKAIADDPETYPLQTLSEGLRAIGHEPQYTRNGDLQDTPGRIPEAFPERGQSMLPPSG